MKSISEVCDHAGVAMTASSTLWRTLGEFGGECGVKVAPISGAE